MTDNGPSPLEKAEDLERQRRVEPQSAAALVLVTGHGWSPATHPFLPAPARSRAVALLRLGYLLSRLPAWESEGVVGAPAASSSNIGLKTAELTALATTGIQRGEGEPLGDYA